MPEEVPYWELPLDRWYQMYTVGLRSTYVASDVATAKSVSAKGGYETIDVAMNNRTLADSPHSGSAAWLTGTRT